MALAQLVRLVGLEANLVSRSACLPPCLKGTDGHDQAAVIGGHADVARLAHFRFKAAPARASGVVNPVTVLRSVWFP